MQRGVAALATPTVILVLLAVLFGVTTYGTLRYQPDYLHLPHLWAALAAVASVTCAWSLAQPGRVRVAVAGAACIGAAAARAIAIAVQLVTHPPAGPLFWSFVLAAVTWAAVALLINSLWQHVVLPWSATARVSR